VGDLGNDVNDDTLARAFSKYSSFMKARVIRDKFTKKTKGFGFVSFKSPQDFMQAMKDMNGEFLVFWFLVQLKKNNCRESENREHLGAVYLNLTERLF